MPVNYMVVILLGNVVTHLIFRSECCTPFGGTSAESDDGHDSDGGDQCIARLLLFIYGFGWGIRGAAIGYRLLRRLIALVMAASSCSADKDELIRLHKGDFPVETENRVGFAGNWYGSFPDEYGSLALL